MSEAAADVKRARTMPEDASDTSPRRITQALGADETHSMRDLFASWGLPARFHEGVAPQWRCRLVPMASDEATQREMACAGVPFLAPVEHAREVFDAMGGEDGNAGGGGDGVEGRSRDGVSWACDAEWNAFARPKVAMVGGWGAPGSHLLSERHMRMVSSFSDVVDSEEPLNLQMFHRGDGNRIPALPEKLKWPLPEFFSTAPHPDVADAVRELEKRRKRSRDEARTEAEDAEKEEHTTSEVLPAQGAARGVGGVGVPLDTATRLSAAGALTWWHLDDCGEFVFQVGLPLDPTLPRRPRAKREPPRMLLGPTGRPVVKLFVFAEKKDYEWIAQDGVMNATTKQSALDLFDTPEWCVPSEREMADAASETRGDRRFDARDETPDGAPNGWLPTFWVAPLEAGGPPLLSPPNVIHCVITARDCVMVEARRVSLAFLDEVEYFRRRAARWCEPPVQYRFVREDLPDAEMCRVVAAMPLARRLRDTRAALMAHAAPLGESSEDARRDARALAATLARLVRSAARCSAVIPPRTRWTRRRARGSRERWTLARANRPPRGHAGGATRECLHSRRLARIGRGARRARRGRARDASRALLDAMAEGGRARRAQNRRGRRAFARGIGIRPRRRRRRRGQGAGVRVVHERGRPRWGPARATVEEAVADRKAMRAAIKAGALDEWLRRLRPPAEASRER